MGVFGASTGVRDACGVAEADIGVLAAFGVVCGVVAAARVGVAAAEIYCGFGVIAWPSSRSFCLNSGGTGMVNSATGTSACKGLSFGLPILKALFWGIEEVGGRMFDVLDMLDEPELVAVNGNSSFPPFRLHRQMKKKALSALMHTITTMETIRKRLLSLAVKTLGAVLLVFKVLAFVVFIVVAAFVVAAVAATVVEIRSGTIRLEITGGAADNTETPEVATAEDSKARASAPETLSEAASIAASAKFAMNVVSKVDASFAL